LVEKARGIMRGILAAIGAGFPSDAFAHHGAWRNSRKIQAIGGVARIVSSAGTDFWLSVEKNVVQPQTG